MAEYKLSASLVGHQGEVRAITFPDQKNILSASLDGTVRSWKLLSDNPPIFDAALSSNAHNWLTSLAYLPPSEQFSEGLIVSGGRDTVIDVRQPSKTADDNAEALLLGHRLDICALAVDPAGKFIVSGSKDDTARIWPIGNWESSGVLRGHKGAVWAVLPYDSETIITACADEFIRIYTTNGISGKLVTSIPGDTRIAVRALCRLENHPSGADFASASGDADQGVIRLWRISGEQVGELRGHTSYIYQLASLPSGEIFSVGEDHTLRVWRGSECVQTITHPTQTVWSVSACQETGDVVTAASDGVVRTFSREPSRMADAETIQQFDASVEKFLEPQEPQVYYSELPGPEFLTKKSATKENQPVMILELEEVKKSEESEESQESKPPVFIQVVKAYQPSADGWICHGKVDEKRSRIVDDLPKSKIEHEGKEYDYVIDVPLHVEASRSDRQLKFAFNFHDPLLETAERFLERNGLGRNGGRGDFDHDLEMVQNFIMQSVPAVGRRQKRIKEEEKKYKDEKKLNGSSGEYEPWGSGDRYRPEDAPSTSRPPQSSQTSQALPQKQYFNIMNADAETLKVLILKANKALVDAGKKDISLNSKELEIVSACCKDIQNPRLSKNYKNTRNTLELCVKMITQWPYSERTGAMGIIFLLAGQVEAALYTQSQVPPEQDIIKVLLNSCKESDPPKENYIVMTIRAIVNLFASPSGISLAKSNFLQYQALITSSLDNGTTNRNLLIAIATLYQNLSVAFHDAGADGATPDSEIVYEVFTTLPKILATYPVVAERGLTALGTFLDIGVGVKKLAQELKLEETVNDVVKKYIGEPKIKQLGVELKGLFVIQNEDTKMEG